jgi:hypothetical protein
MLPVYQEIGYKNLLLIIQYNDINQEKFKSLLKREWKGNFKIICDHIPDCGTGASLINALPFLEARFSVVNGDSWLEIDGNLKSELKKHMTSGSNSLLIAAKPSARDVANLLYSKVNKSALSYQKSGFNFFDLSKSTGSSSGIDYGIFIASKKTLIKFIAIINSDIFDIGVLYNWLIDGEMMKVIETESPYIDIGTYKGWSLLSTKKVN